MPNYPYDPTARASTNLIANELVTVTPPNDTEDASFFIPAKSPFFKDTMVIRDGSSPSARKLVFGADYYFSHDYIEMEQVVSKPICGGVVLTNRNFSGNLYITYQTLGGEHLQDVSGEIERLTRLEFNITYVKWSQVAKVPLGFPAAYHDHDLGDTFGYDDIIDKLSSIANAIVNRPPAPTNGQAADAALQEHINAVSAHSKSQVGLSDVANFGVANQTDADNLKTNKYVVPSIVNYMISRYLNNNPITAETVFKILNNPNASGAPDIVYTTIPDDKTIFLFKGIENTLTAWDVNSQTQVNQSSAGDVYLCMQTFSLASNNETLPGALSRRYIIAFGVNTPKVWVKSLNHTHGGLTSSVWRRMIDPAAVGLEKVRNIGYVDYRNWEQAVALPPNNNSTTYNDDLYVTLSAMRKVVEKIREEVASVKEAIKVGDTYLTTINHVDATAVADHLGYGTWIRWGEGKALVGQNPTASNAANTVWTKTIGSTFGSNQYVLIKANLPSVALSNGSIDEPITTNVSSHVYGSTPVIEDQRYVGGNAKGISNVNDNNQKFFTGLTEKMGTDKPIDLAQPSITIGVWKRLT